MKPLLLSDRENMKRISGETSVFGLQTTNEPRRHSSALCFIQKRSSRGRQSKLLGWHTGQNPGPPSQPWDPGSAPWLQACLRKAGSLHVHQPAFTKTFASSAYCPGSPEDTLSYCLPILITLFAHLIPSPSPSNFPSDLSSPGASFVLFTIKKEGTS